jgi:hypothetical protein
MVFLFLSETINAHWQVKYIMTTECFSDRIIGRGQWPPHLQDVNSCKFYLWSTFKDKNMVTTITSKMI